MSFISYMGTKAALAHDIARELAALPHGPLLDAFAGMSAVGRAVSTSRNVWTNDVQAFSHAVSKFQFQSGDLDRSLSADMRKILLEFRRHSRLLEREYERELAAESQVLIANDWVGLTKLEENLRSRLPTLAEQQKPLWQNLMRPYRLFTMIYAGTYFGLRQSIEIDAIRRAIDHVFPDEESHQDARGWLIVALGAALSRCASSTGHFAQYLGMSERNFSRILGQRRRGVAREWVRQLRLVRPIGSSDWRRGNRVFQQDACGLLSEVAEFEKLPAVVYADPPYTADQYSRYYHLLDTLALYDYPCVGFKGRYRLDRFVSDWSLKSKVESCFKLLIEKSRSIDAALVISYPTNGLLSNSEEVICSMMSEAFPRVRMISKPNFQHSTMGGSKGLQRQSVTEQLFVGYLN